MTDAEMAEMRVRKALDRCASRLVAVPAADVVTVCDALPADADLTAATLRRGAAAAPKGATVAVHAHELRAVMDRLAIRSGADMDATFDATAAAFKEESGG